MFSHVLPESVTCFCYTHMYFFLYDSQGVSIHLNTQLFMFFCFFPFLLILFHNCERDASDDWLMNSNNFQHSDRDQEPLLVLKNDSLGCTLEWNLPVPQLEQGPLGNCPNPNSVHSLSSPFSSVKREPLVFTVSAPVLIILIINR